MPLATVADPAAIGGHREETMDEPRRIAGRGGAQWQGGDHGAETAVRGNPETA